MADKYLKSLQFETGGDIYHPLPLIEGGDGKTWTQSDVDSSFVYVYYANGIWVACSYNTQNGLFYSTNGKTWTQSNITNGQFYSVYYGNGTWVACSDGDGLYYSLDGMEWIQSNIASDTFDCVYYDNDNSIWVVGSAVSSVGLYYSSDGMEWTQSNITDDDFICVHYADGTWVASSSKAYQADIGNGLYYSLDGMEWTQSDITGSNFNQVYYAKGIWVAACSGNNGYGLYYSTNGIEWTQSSALPGFYCVYYANGVWVAGSDENHGLHYSLDGKSWTQSNITSGDFYCVYYANGLWVAGSYNKGLYYSTNGRTWTQSNITSGIFNCVYYANGIWVACNYNNGELYYSELSSSLNGLILQVVNGEWTVTDLPNTSSPAEVEQWTVTLSTAGSSVTSSKKITDVSSLQVYQNGLLMTVNTNYTVKSDLTGIDLVGYTAAAGDIFTFICGKGKTSLTEDEIVKGEVTATAGQSVINLPIKIASTEGLTVFENGILIAEGKQYTATTSAITLVGYAADAGDVYTFMSNKALIGLNSISDASQISLNSTKFSGITNVQSALEKCLLLSGGEMEGELGFDSTSYIYFSDGDHMIGSDSIFNVFDNSITTFDIIGGNTVYLSTQTFDSYIKITDNTAYIHGHGSTLTVGTTTVVSNLSSSSTAQVRNIMYGTSDPISSQGSNGDIYIKYTA